ncbi:MAG: hypothetical protein KDA21_06655, partial [Phycisphaerales bacterium]|nr:hypothetical protein [Phycisphaerales bacterium]
MSDIRKVLSAVLRKDRMALLAKAFAELSPHDKFEPGWHLEALMWQLERCRLLENRRLLINMPPRSGKSIATSVVFVALALGINPKLRFLCASYSKELAIVFANQTRQIMNTAWYKRAFPNTRISRKNTETEFTTTAGGGRVTTSMGATLTGRGADFIILDDPHNAEDVHSPTLRDRAERWFKEGLLTRLNQKKTGVVIVVAQRLHEDDLCGRLIEDGGWTKLILPAVATETEIHWIGHRKRHRRRAGEVLQPNREPQETLDRERETLGSARFEAMYQQSPVPAGGNMIKADSLRYYVNPPFVEGFVLQSWDCASSLEEERSYSVCTTWKVVGNYFLLDLFRQRVEFPALLRHAKRLAELYRPNVVRIERAASGIPLAQTLRTVEGVRV